MPIIKNQKFGFTLIELLVVMAILGILSVIGIGNFRNAQIKARDSQRKSDLQELQRSLEMYSNDYGGYPQSTVDGEIKVGLENLSWKTKTVTGSEFIDSKETLYMKELVGDPIGIPNYCYNSSGNSYRVYAKLENSQDPAVGGPYSCGGEDTYNYGVTSSNSSL